MRRLSAIRDAARSLRRAARAARRVAGDQVAASLLASALSATPDPFRSLTSPLRDDLLCVRLAAEHGLSLEEFVALDPEQLIDLFWPEQASKPGTPSMG